MKLEMEIQRFENDDWQHKKEVVFNRRNAKSFQRQAKKLIESKEVHQVHLCARGDDDPEFQEFYYKDGTVTKMF